MSILWHESERTYTLRKEALRRFCGGSCVVNRMKDLRLNKGLENLQRLRKILAAASDRFASFEAQALNVHVDFPLFQRLALAVTVGKTKAPGIKIHDTRLLRLMGALLQESTQIDGWRTGE